MKLSELFTEFERLADEQQRPPELVAESALNVYKLWLTLPFAERERLAAVIDVAAYEKLPLRELFAGKKEQSVGDTNNR